MCGCEESREHVQHRIGSPHCQPARLSAPVSCSWYGPICCLCPRSVDVSRGATVEKTLTLGCETNFLVVAACYASALEAHAFFHRVPAVGQPAAVGALRPVAVRDFWCFSLLSQKSP